MDERVHPSLLRKTFVFDLLLLFLRTFVHLSRHYALSSAPPCLRASVVAFVFPH